jgi:hypothetical protein
MYTFMLRLAGQLLDAAYVVIEQLKGLCHEIENAYNGLLFIDQKNLWLPRHIFNSLIQSMLGGLSRENHFVNNE